MQRRVLLLGLMGSALAGCGEGRLGQSRLNPRNWFQRRAPEVVADAGFVAPVDPRGLIAQIDTIKLEPTATGLILRARGLALGPGYFDAELVGLPVDEQGVKTYEFRIRAPVGGPQGGPLETRTITAAAALSFYQLQSLQALRVAGAENALIARP